MYMSINTVDYKTWSMLLELKLVKLDARYKHLNE